MEAVEACEKVLNGIEDDTINGNSALLICKKIARLTHDNEAIVWLDYELGGYPRTPDKRIESSAFKVGLKHNRGYYNSDGKQCIFTDLVAELEDIIEINKKSISAFTTNGTSVSGDYALSAMNRLVSTVTQNVSSINNNIKEFSKRKGILMSEYYNYAHIKKVELLYGNCTYSIFEQYQNIVNNYFSSIDKELLLKLDAIQNAMIDNNPESYSQALTTCRKLFVEIAKDLFAKVLPNYDKKTFKTKSGKEIDVTGDHTNNQLSAVIETICEKGVKNTIVGSNVIYLVDWIESLSCLQSKGVHNTITKEDAEKCVIQTYIALAGIISIFLENNQKE